MSTTGSGTDACHRALSIPEIVGTIFLSADSLDVPDKHQIPLNVSQTCREWRYIAINYAALWSHLKLEIDTVERKGVDYLKLLRFWLPRSGGRPMELLVKFIWTLPGSFEDFPKEDLHRAQQYAGDIVQLFSTYQHRWRTVYLVSSGPSFPDDFSVTLSYMPLLESLHIGYTSLDGIETPRHTLISDTELDRVHATYILDASVESPVFHNLHTLELFLISNPTVGEGSISLFTALKETPNLERLRVHYEVEPHLPDLNWMVQIPDSGHRITLPRLRELDWKVISSKFSELLRMFLITPALEVLMLVILGDEFGAYGDWIRTRMPEGAPSLTKLSLDFYTTLQFDPESVVALLSAIPSIQYLTIRISSLEDAWQRRFWHLLAYHGSDNDNDTSQTQLCPDIRILNIRIYFCQDPPNHPYLVDIMKTIRSRLQRGRFAAQVELGWPKQNPNPPWDGTDIMDKISATAESLDLRVDQFMTPKRPCITLRFRGYSLRRRRPVVSASTSGNGSGE
ncbi:hypothetical protein BC629DRAFT_1595170 [Irpex lacteus]|nr:hypothetical protein BC629DRAFT_1595170 [Irpex lacteus]